MDWDTASTIILVASATIVYCAMYYFFKKHKFPVFIGRPKEAFKKFLLLEMAAAVPILVVEGIPLIMNSSWQIFGIIAGIAEEPGKILPVIYLAHKNRFFREYVKDKGWFYIGLIAGLAFGVFEGVLYTIGIYGQESSLITATVEVVFGRIPVIWLHILFTLIATWAYSQYLNGKKITFIAGLTLAITMHSSYDYLVYSSYVLNNDFYIFVATLIYPLALIAYYLLYRKAKHFYDSNDLGWLFRTYIVEHVK